LLTLIEYWFFLSPLSFSNLFDGGIHKIYERSCYLKHHQFSSGFTLYILGKVIGILSIPNFFSFFAFEIFNNSLMVTHLDTIVKQQYFFAYNALLTRRKPKKLPRKR